MNKLAVIPFTALLMTPFSAFADAPSVTITPSDVYADDNVHDFDNENGNGLGLLDWTCSGMNVSGHDYVAALFLPGQDSPSQTIITCDETDRINFVGGVEGSPIAGTAHIVVWDDDIYGNSPYNGGMSYEWISANIDNWIVSASTVELHSTNRPL